MKKFIALILAAGISAAQFTVFAANETIDVQVNEISVYADDKYIASDNFLYRDRTFIPLRGVLEALKCEVSYDEQTNTASAFNASRVALGIYRFATMAQNAAIESKNMAIITQLLYTYGETEGFDVYYDTYLKLKEQFDSFYEDSVVTIKAIQSKYGQNTTINNISCKTLELFDATKKAYEYGEKTLTSTDQETYKNHEYFVELANDLYYSINYYNGINELL